MVARSFGTREPDEFSLEIDGTEYRFWESLEISRYIDAFDQVTFTAPFEADRKEFRQKFRPGSFADVNVLAGGERIFTGTMVNVLPAVDDNGRRSAQVSCYAKCGVWNDCTIPIDSYPMQVEGLKLDKIANMLGAPFGLTPAIADSVGAKFDKVKIESSQTPFAFLSELAKQRGLLISSDDDGNPLFWKALELDEPAAVLEWGKPPLTSISPQLDGQRLFSTVTGICKTKHGRKGSSYSEANAFLQSPIRPFVFELDDTDPGDIQLAVQSRIGRMWGEAVGYEIGLVGVLDDNGSLWNRNRFVKLTAPDMMIYSPTDFIVKGLVMSITAESKTTNMALCLPGSYSGSLPESLPWDE